MEQSVSDDRFQALGDPLRRELLCLMDSREREVFDSDQLSETLGTLCDDSAEYIAVALKHSHLPKLHAAGLIEYDDRSGTVRYGQRDIVSVLRDNDLIECKTCSSGKCVPSPTE